MPIRIIKRYKNRRLYDTREKSTIKLGDIARLIREDIDFKVIENSTGRDVTLSVLAQLLPKEINSWKDLKDSNKTIKRIIKLGGEGVMDFFEKAALAGLGLFDLTTEKVEKIVDELVKRGEVAKGDKAKIVKSVIEGHKERTEKIKAKIDEGIKKAVEKVRSLEKEELKELHNKIEKLSKTLENLEKKLNSK
jgi:polyhydroxyalkanoate synthesis repressor PhaR